MKLARSILNALTRLVSRRAESTNINVAVAATIAEAERHRGRLQTTKGHNAALHVGGSCQF